MLMVLVCISLRELDFRHPLHYHILHGIKRMYEKGRKNFLRKSA